MKIEIIRDEFSPDWTIGTLSIDGKFFCYTLEDADRHLESGGEKDYGNTCIPRGSYKCVIDFSNRFKKELPRLLDVPQFSGVRIHQGNTAEDTEGCILVGTSRKVGFIGNSRAAFDKLFSVMEEAYQRGEEITVEVE